MTREEIGGAEKEREEERCGEERDERSERGEVEYENMNMKVRRGAAD